MVADINNNHSILPKMGSFMGEMAGVIKALGVSDLTFWLDPEFWRTYSGSSQEIELYISLFRRGICNYWWILVLYSLFWDTVRS